MTPGVGELYANKWHGQNYGLLAGGELTAPASAPAKVFGCGVNEQL